MAAYRRAQTGVGAWRQPGEREQCQPQRASASALGVAHSEPRHWENLVLLPRENALGWCCSSDLARARNTRFRIAVCDAIHAFCEPLDMLLKRLFRLS